MRFSINLFALSFLFVFSAAKAQQGVDKNSNGTEAFKQGELAAQCYGFSYKAKKQMDDGKTKPDAATSLQLSNMIDGFFSYGLKRLSYDDFMRVANNTVAGLGAVDRQLERAVNENNSGEIKRILSENTDVTFGCGAFYLRAVYKEVAIKK